MVRNLLVLFICQFVLQLSMAKEVENNVKQTITQSTSPANRVQVDSLNQKNDQNPMLLRFEISVNDESLYLALRRWASAADYQLVWGANKDFPAHRAVYMAVSFESAVEYVMADTEASAYPLHACAYPNRVMRVLHVSQSCERK